MKRAVEEDQRENYKDAYYLYCDGLQYFIPLIAAETDAEKRLHLQERATTYMERAEEIKKTFKQAFIQRQYSRSASTEGQCCSKESESSQRSTTDTSFKHLRKITLLLGICVTCFNCSHIELTFEEILVHQLLSFRQ